MERDLAPEPCLGDELNVTCDDRQSQCPQEMLLACWSSVIFSEQDLILGPGVPVHLVGSLEDLDLDRHIFMVFMHILHGIFCIRSFSLVKTGLNVFIQLEKMGTK